MIDSSLDGIADNDADNRDTPSYTDGQIYTLQDLTTSQKRDHTIRLMIQGADGSIIASRMIHIVLDYIASTSESGVDLSGSGVTGLSQNDRTKLEELSKMIRELTDTDRIGLMQRYNTLVENWNNPFDKAKSLIDIQEGIESSTMDTTVKTKMSGVVDDLLIGDAVATDEVAVAVHLIRDLIPKESPNHDVLIAKLAEIESHPGVLESNRALGKEMLTLIQTDTTIPDKYKIHIKNQLSIIINGGSASVSAESTGSTTVTTDTSVSSGILGFIGGFVKVFFIIIAIILVIALIGFIFYRISRKDDNIGFQDFLIDSVFHSREKPESVASTPVSNTVIVTPAPIVTPSVDPLSSYTPPAPVVQPTPDSSPTPVAQDPLSDALARTEAPIAPVIEAAPVAVEHIPDWLKVPSSSEKIVETKEVGGAEGVETEEIGDRTGTKELEVETKEVETEETEIQTIDENPNTSHTEESNTPILQSADTPDTTDDIIPDWIKEVQSIPAEPVVAVVPDDQDVLPDWLRNSIEAPADTTEDQKTETTETVAPDEIDTPTPVKKAPKKPKAKKEVEKPEESVEITPPVSKTPESIPSWLQ